MSPSADATVTRTPAAGRSTRSARDVRVLFDRWHGHGDLAAREQLVTRFTPFAAQLARRYRYAGGEPYEDLVQVASLGLVKAIDRFDPARGFAFASFATPTILGELRRYFRDSTWSVHLPRDLQEHVLKVERHTQELHSRLGRSPTVQEIAGASRLDEEEVLDALAAARGARARSLERPIGRDEDGEITLADRHGTWEGGYDAVEYGASVEQTMASFTDRNREIVRLRFAEDLTQSEIARRVGISQMQVSRVLSRCLRELREAAAD